MAGERIELLLGDLFHIMQSPFLYARRFRRQLAVGSQR